ELVAVMEQVEGGAAKLAGLEAELARLVAERDREASELRETLARLSAEIERERAARSELAQTIDDDLRRKYEMIFSRRGGLGAAPPPEEVCKPDSALPPRKREQQPFVWSPGCPGDRATDPRERTGSPRLASRPDLPPTRSCSRWGLPSVRPHERTW